MEYSKEIDNYIAQFPKETQDKLTQMRRAIQQIATDAIETMNYGMPTFQLFGNLVHFAGYKNHIGFYPAPSGLSAFQKEIEVFKNSKGAVQFPIDHELPIALIQKIVAFRIEENTFKFKEKNKKTCKFGHVFYKSSTCKSCPTCAKNEKPTDGFLAFVSAPARRALLAHNIDSLEKLSNYSEQELLQLHGIGKTTIPILVTQLKIEGLALK